MQRLRANPGRVHQFVRLLLPVLVELYSASPATKLRSRVLNGLTKAIAFCDEAQLRLALKVESASDKTCVRCGSPTVCHSLSHWRVF